MINIKTNINKINNKRPMINFIGLFLILFNINSLFGNTSFEILNNLNNLNNKCLWVESNLLLDSTTVDSVLEYALSNKINKLFVKARDNGKAYYVSNIVYNANHEFDPLLYIISKSRDTEIDIYAWIDMYKLWDENRYPPLITSDLVDSNSLIINQKHFYYQCVDCLEADINGKSDSYIKLDKLQSIEWDGIFLSPIHPQVNPYLLSVVEEIVNNYNIDGIYLDYLQYQNFYFGYNKEGINLFEELYGFDPKDINKGLISVNYGYSKEEVERLTKSWDIYRSDKITELIQYISNYCRYNFPELVISTSVNFSLFDAKNRFFQSWDIWLDNNYIDIIILKDRTSNFNDFIYELNLIQKKYLDKDRFIINFDSNQNPLDISEKIFYLRLNNFNGAGIPFDNSNWSIPILKTINFEIR